MHANSIYFLLFPSIHDLLRAEKILKRHGLSFELVPVPRDLSSDCGMCIKFEGSVDDVLLHLDGLPPEKCFSYDETDCRKWIQLNPGKG